MIEGKTNTSGVECKLVIYLIKMVGNTYCSRVEKNGFQCPLEFLLNLRLFFVIVGNIKNLIFQAILKQVVVY